MPEGETALTAPECYRFVLSNPDVDVCMTGTKTVGQMKENLAVLEQVPLKEEEMRRIRKTGEYLYKK